MRRFFVAILGAVTLVLAFLIALDSLDLLSHSRIGTMSNGVVGRDVLLRGSAGLQPYDHVRSTRDPGSSGWREFIAGEDYSTRNSIRLRVLRSGRQLELEIHPKSWNVVSLGLSFAAPFAVSLLLIGSALTLAWYPRSHLAVPAVIAVLGILGLQQLTAFDANWSHRFEVLYVATVVMFPFALIHLVLAFPHPVHLLRETPGMIRSLYALGGLTLGAALLLVGTLEERLILLLRVLELVTLAAGLALAARICISLSSAVPAADRYRARILAYGAGVAFGFPALSFIIDLASPSNLTGVLVPVSAAAIPLSIGIAVGREDLLEVEERYLHLLLPAAVTSCSVVALFLILSGAFQVAGIDEAPGSSAFSIAFVATLTLLLEGARRLLFVGVEHLRPSPESRIRRFLDQAERTLPLDDELGSVDFSCGFLLEEFEPSFVAILWLEPGSGRLRTIRTEGEVPEAVNAIDLAPDSESALQLLGSASYLSSPNLGERERQSWSQAGLNSIDLALPMSTGRRTLGVLALGARRAGYAAADLDLLSLLATAIALRLEQEQRLRALERRLEERSSSLARALTYVKENGGYAPLWSDDEKRFAWIGKLAAGISHEANKPLYVIEHHLSRLGTPHAPERRRLRSIAAEVAQLRRLMRDLQAYAGSRTRAREARSVESVIDEALRNWRKTGNGLRVQKSGELGLEVELDAELVRRLFAVLFQNASEVGAQNLALRVRPRAEGVLIEIEDDGPGIPAGLERQIFEPFFTTRRVGSASGLGLAIAREIARAHGGSLNASPRHRGARFELWLPRRAPETRAG